MAILQMDWEVTTGSNANGMNDDDFIVEWRGLLVGSW
jgi:hypothetical protein